jgi:hypothetical protein
VIDGTAVKPVVATPGWVLGDVLFRGIVAETCGEVFAVSEFVKFVKSGVVVEIAVETGVKVLAVGNTGTECERIPEGVLVGASYTSFSIFQWKVELQPVTYRVEHTPDMDDIAPYKQLAMQGAKLAAPLSKGRTEVEFGSDQASYFCCGQKYRQKP